MASTGLRAERRHLTAAPMAASTASGFGGVASDSVMGGVLNDEDAAVVQFADCASARTASRFVRSRIVSVLIRDCVSLDRRRGISRAMRARRKRADRQVAPRCGVGAIRQRSRKRLCLCDWASAPSGAGRPDVESVRHGG